MSGVCAFASERRCPALLLRRSPGGGLGGERRASARLPEAVGSPRPAPCRQWPFPGQILLLRAVVLCNTSIRAPVFLWF